MCFRNDSLWIVGKCVFATIHSESVAIPSRIIRNPRKFFATIQTYRGTSDLEKMKKHVEIIQLWNLIRKKITQDFETAIQICKTMSHIPPSRSYSWILVGPTAGFWNPVFFWILKQNRMSQFLSVPGVLGLLRTKNGTKHLRYCEVLCPKMRIVLSRAMKQLPAKARPLVCVAASERRQGWSREGDGYAFIAAPRSPDLRHEKKRRKIRRHLCYCSNEQLLGNLPGCPGISCGLVLVLFSTLSTTV